MVSSKDLEFYYKRLAELYKNQCIGSLLGWDQSVLMPPKAAKARADQKEYISLAFHEMATDPSFAQIVDALFADSDNLSEADQISVRLTKRALDIERKLPAEFLAESTQASAASYNTWVQARPADDFAATKPHLEKLVDLAKRRSELLGYDEHPYDPLLDEYDPGAKIAVVKPLLVELGEELRQLLPQIMNKLGEQKEITGHFEKSAQNQLCRKVAQDLGFNFESGRLDISPHPFMTSLGPLDYRITTRYDESNFIGALYGVIHETGHALYEMGLPEDYGKCPPMGSPLSSSIHESQSRLWENMVGRSREFSVYLSGFIGDFFPDSASTLSTDDLWAYANQVIPSLIRTEADEVTYSLHIVIRLLLEEQLITDQLSIADLPDAWNDMYEKYLGIRPPTNKDGVMQDVHWFTGGFGYFPTYALGNLYNAMMMESASEAIPDLPQKIENGQFAPLLAWLRENVHKHGMRYYSPELIKKVTGKELSAKPFTQYLKKKFLS